MHQTVVPLSKHAKQTQMAKLSLVGSKYLLLISSFVLLWIASVLDDIIFEYREHQPDIMPITSNIYNPAPTQSWDACLFIAKILTLS